MQIKDDLYITSGSIDLSQLQYDNIDTSKANIEEIITSNTIASNKEEMGQTKHYIKVTGTPTKTTSRVSKPYINTEIRQIFSSYAPRADLAEVDKTESEFMAVDQKEVERSVLQQENEVQEVLSDKPDNDLPEMQASEQDSDLLIAEDVPSKDVSKTARREEVNQQLDTLVEFMKKNTNKTQIDDTPIQSIKVDTDPEPIPPSAQGKPIGKRVKKDVVDTNGYVVVKKGEYVDKDILLEAKEKGCLTTLIINSFG
ncbi:MAG: hypothetical protein ATN35_06975 [Epulopiscium sp. Nele67-Bin004]|nr:MAG: hypothetical protein ATN35_06975 [Epulopiscium sp. Nele67-Bin004]